MTSDAGTAARPVMFITGGSRGIGAELVRAAAAAGYDVAFTYRARATLAERLCEDVRQANPASRCRAYAMELRDSATVERVADEVLSDFDTVHAVVANAAVTQAGLVFSTSDEEWREVIDTNLTGAFYVVRQFLPALLANGFGRFIFVSSIAAAGMAGSAAYAASKAGLLGLSASLAKEYGRKGVTSNALLLSLFETEMSERDLSGANRDFFLRYCPVGRAGRVPEVASAVLYLASREASFINGQAIGVNGGLEWSM
jgi:NAD(P)-dependent dehydrogenase (short-subunit alcohol dehydrogenase family)